MLKLIKKILLILSVIFILSKLILVSAIYLYPKITIEDINLNVGAQELVAMTNGYRTDMGLNPLTVNARLTQAAVNKARDILTKQYFNHTSPDNKPFSYWIREVNYNYFYVGENLAIDFETNQDAFNAWLASPSHRDNIEKPQYQEIGIAVLPGKFANHSSIVIVQLFGTRVLGEQDSNNKTGQPIQNPFTDLELNIGQNYWEKIISLKNLEKLSQFDNYLLVFALGLYLIIYTPKKRVHQINIKNPIINRYQAKMFKE